MVVGSGVPRAKDMRVWSMKDTRLLLSRPDHPTFVTYLTKIKEKMGGLGPPILVGPKQGISSIAKKVSGFAMFCTSVF